MPYNEKELLMRVADGDQSAYRDLVYKINPKLTTFVTTHIGIKNEQLIEEAVCDVLLQLWLSRETLPDLDNFDNYLFILARNKGLDILKKELRERNRRKLWTVPGDNIDEKELFVAESHALSLIHTAVARLPPQQQKVWTLSRRRSLTYAQIASEMNISKETVKSYLQAANQSVKAFVLDRMKDFPHGIYLFIFFLRN